ncbi:MAG: hypothetical protein ABH879_05275 [archaeon]
MSIGRHHSTLIRRYENGDRLHSVVARADGIELVRLPPQSGMDDAEYWLLKNDGTKATIGLTGLVREVEEYSNPGRSGRYRDSENVLSRTNGFGYFRDHDSDIRLLLDGVYEDIRRLEFTDPDQKGIFDWTGEQVQNRFEDYRSLYGPGDIVPEFNDTMNVVRVSADCPNRCPPCPLGTGNFVMFPEETIRYNAERARGLQLRHHGEYAHLMNEVFPDSSDILLFHRLGGTDPRKIAEILYEKFPEARKMPAFTSVKSVNETGFAYLRDLRQAGYSRFLVGIEAFHGPMSRFLGKNESPSEKGEALLKLLEAGYKVKPIMQIIDGESFRQGGREVSIRNGVRATLEYFGRIIDPMKHKNRVKVLVSVTQPIPGTPMARMYENGTITPHSDPDGLEKMLKSVRRFFHSRDIPAETEYEVALEGRVRA